MNRRDSKPNAGRCSATWVLTAAILAGVMIGAWLPATCAETAPINEYQVKAVFLYNFVQFTDWPEEAFPATNTSFCIGVLGEDPFGKALEQTVAGESIKGHNLNVRRAKKLEDLKDCQLLFISKSEKPRLAQILAACENDGVLTVSEIEGFTAHGGVINFYIRENKIRFEINAAAARRKGLKISAQLLRLGTIFTP